MPEELQVASPERRNLRHEQVKGPAKGFSEILDPEPWRQALGLTSSLTAATTCSYQLAGEGVSLGFREA